VTLPVILSTREDSGALTFELDLPPGLPYFDGHFPEIPILPAVAQIDWAVRLARAHFDVSAGFSSLRALKFLRVVQPPAPLTLELKRHSAHAIAFEYSQASAACSSGRIEFTDDAPGAGRTLL
jgi:3-hydroxymyristoyl/3-hydroxydecanoyl-(acyl carrier protein) dehydratase